jgi:uncharacterized membrane protein
MFYGSLHWDSVDMGTRGLAMFFYAQYGLGIINELDEKLKPHFETQLGRKIEKIWYKVITVILAVVSLLFVTVVLFNLLDFNPLLFLCSVTF